MSYKENRKNRISVWENTVELFTSGQFKNFQPGNSTYFTHNNSEFKNLEIEKKYQTLISVLNEDVLSVAQILSESGELDPLVLNLASFTQFLGGVANGAMAQEEELGRRTNYFKTDSEKFYPFKKMETIYTPNVTVIKNPNYELISKPFTVAMIAAAAIKYPELMPDGKFNDWDYQVMCNTIDNIFKVAILKKHDVLVLGALGCGVFKCPAENVVKIFNIYLEKYNGCFKIIIFTVLSKSDNNFSIFDNNIKRFF